MQNKINFMIPHRVRICLYFTHTPTKNACRNSRVIAICDARTNRTKYKCKHKHRTNDEVSEFKVGETIAIIALSQHLIGSLTNTNITIAKWCDRYVAVQASKKHLQVTKLLAVREQIKVKINFSTCHRIANKWIPTYFIHSIHEHGGFIDSNFFLKNVFFS